MSHPSHDPPRAPVAAGRGADRWTRRLVEASAGYPQALGAAGLFAGLAAALGLAAGLCAAAGSPAIAGGLVLAATLPGVFSAEFALLAVSNRRAQDGWIAAVRCSACDFAVAAWRHRLGVRLVPLFGLDKTPNVWETKIWPAMMRFHKWSGVLAVAAAAFAGVVAVFQGRFGAELLLVALLAAFGALSIALSRWKYRWPPPEVNAGRACPLCWEPLLYDEPGTAGDA